VTQLDTIVKGLGSHRRNWGAGLKPVWAADPEDQPKERDKKKQFLKRICVGGEFPAVEEY
jgi:hypothetical protein